MKPTKQTVYLPVKVEEGLDIELSTNGKGEKIIYISENISSKDAYSHWLKPQEGYFFTPEQLNQLLSDVIKDALSIAAEKADLIETDGDVDPKTTTNTFQETFNKFKV